VNRASAVPVIVRQRGSFDSAGLRCCSIACERRCRDRSENEQLMSQVDMERPTKRKCEQCDGVIPNWRNGRRVKKTTRFCSQKCSKASKSLMAQTRFWAPKKQKEPRKMGISENAKVLRKQVVKNKPGPRDGFDPATMLKTATLMCKGGATMAELADAFNISSAT
jgi:hypothetical protein